MKINKTYLILFSGMILWGMYPLFTHKFVLGIDPLFLVSVSTLIASIPFIIQLLLKKEFGQLFLSKNLKTLLFIALFTAIGHGFLFVGTKLTSGTNTGLLLQVEPIYSLILGVIFLGEIISSSQVGATLLMVIGAITIVYKGGVNLNLGDILVLFSPLMFQISHAIAKKLLNKGTDIFLILAGRQLYGGLMLLFFSFIMNKSIINLFNFNSLTSALYLGLFLSAISFCWFSSIKKIPVSVASSFLPLTAVVSLLGSVFFLKETISIQQYLGFFFIVGGMIWQANLPIHKTSS
ncbi:MAG: DMT family transporter [Patescibacteria group bacterium]